GGLLRQGPREHRALPLAAREGLHPPSGQREHAGRGQRRRDDALVLRARRPQQADVRGAAHRDGLRHGEADGHLRLLRDERHAARELEAPEALEIAPVEEHASRRGRELAREEAQQRALARAVGPDEPDHLPRLDPQRDAVEGRGTVPVGRRVAGGDVDGLERPAARVRRASRRGRRDPALLAARPAHARPEGCRARLSSPRKNGPPVTAVTMPTGTSTGAIAVRARRSASTMNAAPHSAATGRSRACAAPVTSLAACGTIKPTKPMIPGTLTHAAVTSEARPRSSSFTDSTGRPSSAAPRSPSWKRSRARASATASATAGAVNAASASTSPH